MHEVPSVIYEASYKIRGKLWEMDHLFSLLLDGRDNVIVSEYVTIVSLVTWRSLERGTLS